MFGRDTTRNAVSPEKNPPTDWSAERGRRERNIAWKARLGNFCFGAPVISDGLVWIGTNNNPPRDPARKEEAAVLLCLRESDGQFLWQYVSPKPREETRWYWASYPLRSIPLVEGDHLWFTNNRWEVVCLDLEPLKIGKGEPREVWTVDLAQQFGVWPMASGMRWGLASSIGGSYQGMLYVSTQQAAAENTPKSKRTDVPALVCLDKNTGKVLGREASGITRRNLDDGWSSPVLASLEDGRTLVLYGGGDGFLYAFDPIPLKDTGILNEIWKVDCNPPALRAGEKQAPPYGIHATPVIDGGRAYVGIGQEYSPVEGNLCCVDLATGRLVWNSRKVGLTLSTPVVHDGIVFAATDGGFVHALDAMTGALLWTYDAESSIVSSPLLVDGKLYVANGDGEIAILDALREGDEKKRPAHKRAFPDGIDASPVFANGTLYVPTDRWLYAIRGQSTNMLNTAAVKRGRAADALFLPTPQDVVEKMLALANVTSQDRVYDLGSGDGRTVIAAAKTYGCKAVGVEIDPTLVEQSSEAIRKESLEKLARIEHEDLLKADFGEASVVTLYVGVRLNRLLVPKLRALNPGSRIVSHEFEIPGVNPEDTIKFVSKEDGREHTLYFYRTPLKLTSAEGR